MPSDPALQTDQTKRYKSYYSSFRRVRKLFRFDIRYRCKRLHEIFERLGMSMENKRVLDVGFGGGDLLASFPKSCDLHGVEISSSAVETAREDQIFSGFKSTKFEVINEADPEQYPKERFDVVLSSHMLEHVPDDMAVLKAIRSRLTEDGILALFVPIEEPGYMRIHVRNYSMETITEKVRSAGYEILFEEGSMYVNGHIWKIITIPSRHNWPVVRHVVDGFRGFTLSLPPYPLLKFMDASLHRLGFGPRQAMVLARVI